MNELEKHFQDRLIDDFHKQMKTNHRLDRSLKYLTLIVFTSTLILAFAGVYLLTK